MKWDARSIFPWGTWGFSLGQIFKIFLSTVSVSSVTFNVCASPLNIRPETERRLICPLTVNRILDNPIQAAYLMTYQTLINNVFRHYTPIRWDVTQGLYLCGDPERSFPLGIMVKILLDPELEGSKQFFFFLLISHVCRMTKHPSECPSVRRHSWQISPASKPTDFNIFDNLAIYAHLHEDEMPYKF